MRILAVADVYDALTANRPYRDAMTPEDALKIMWKDGGKSLDPSCLNAIRELNVLAASPSASGASAALV
jgi:HD-GYP domain-containing protein (c-di-GMP phosphodiesterase class II)